MTQIYMINADLNFFIFFALDFFIIFLHKYYYSYTPSVKLAVLRIAYRVLRIAYCILCMV